jgi:two-component system sensor histidine kinase KdpD
VKSYSVLPLTFTALLTLGAVAAGLNGRLSALWVLVLAAVIVAAMSALGEPAIVPLLGLIGWLTVAGFSARPYAQLRVTGWVSARAAIVLACCCLAGAGAGWCVRKFASSFTLWIVDTTRGPAPEAEFSPELAVGQAAGHRVVEHRPSGRRALPSGHVEPAWCGAAEREPADSELAESELGQRGTGQRKVSHPEAGLSDGLDRRRQLSGLALAAAVLPLLTWGLTGAGVENLNLADDLLIYLVAVVAIAVVGGFWPAVLAAVTASLLLNWYFTPPLHTFTIEEPKNLLALLLFVTVAVTVSSVVHLAARRASQASRSGEEAASLLALAQTVLSGTDTPAAVLDHLTATLGGRAELLELVGDQPVPVAVSGQAESGAAGTRIRVRADLELAVTGQTGPTTPRLIDGFGAQAAAGLDRERLRTQAAQAEALAEGNRMRTALLAAVSHDLRTPLASIKASVSTLRQADVAWTPQDEAALLATIEESADRLDALIGNLLDMSRLATGSLQPFLRPAAIDEVVPVALCGLDSGMNVQIVVPDELPLVRTDPGLLERILANLFSNAIAHSPSERPPAMRARPEGDSVVIEVIDHGPGVPDQAKRRMFEPFERLDDRGSGTGVGLGLAVAKGFAEAMGATLTAADTAGGGLTMRILLPAAARTAVQAAKS